MISDWLFGRILNVLVSVLLQVGCLCCIDIVCEVTEIYIVTHFTFEKVDTKNRSEFYFYKMPFFFSYCVLHLNLVPAYSISSYVFGLGDDCNFLSAYFVTF